MQSLAWEHSNPIVVEHITLMTTMTDYRQRFLDFKYRDRLSVADVVALEHRLGLMKTAAFVAEVDPWCYPHDEARVPVLVKSQEKVL